MTDETASRTWVVLTFGEDRQHAGNKGYDDVPEEWYSYDSFVANHRQIAVGDALLLCDRRRALGIALVVRLEEESAKRVLQRCPACGNTGMKMRLTKEPAYRCKKGHEFERPVSENASCTKYTAHFDGTFKPFTEAFGRDFLRPGCPRYSDQLAMQEFRFSLMEAELQRTFPQARQLISEYASAGYIPASKAQDPEHWKESYQPTESDERERMLRQILARRGQQSFRDKLRVRYLDQCAVSGCNILHVLEAAHIRPYRSKADNHIENGILLRADLHTLFDLDLIGIEPVMLTIHLHKEIDWRDYGEFHGRTLFCPGGRRPSKHALEARWKAFQERTVAK